MVLSYILIRLLCDTKKVLNMLPLCSRSCYTEVNTRKERTHDLTYLYELGPLIVLHSDTQLHLLVALPHLYYCCQWTPLSYNEYAMDKASKRHIPSICWSLSFMIWQTSTSKKCKLEHKGRITVISQLTICMSTIRLDVILISNRWVLWLQMIIESSTVKVKE